MDKLSDFIKNAHIITLELSDDIFEEIGEFTMPLEKDFINNVDISNELKLFERFGLKLEV